MQSTFFLELLVKCVFLLKTKVKNTILISCWRELLLCMVFNVMLSSEVVLEICGCFQITDTDLSLRSVQANKARCFIKLMRSRSVMLYAHYMYDISLELKKVSAVFQDNRSSIAAIHSTMTGTLAVVQKMLTVYVMF